MRSQELLAVGLFGSGSRLGDRVEMLLRGGRTFSGRISTARVVASVAALIACGIAVSFVPRLIVFAQEPAFEVASVKPANPANAQLQRGRWQGGPGSKDPERVDIQGYSMLGLLLTAYDVKSYQISGPNWIQDTRFDIQAKVPAGATRAQFNGMLQTLLAERLGLKVHHETRDFDGYGLVVAKGGPKLKPAAPPGAPLTAEEARTRYRAVDEDGNPLVCPGSICYFSGSRARITAARASLSDLVAHFDGMGGAKPVRDQTGLAGLYEFNLIYDDPNNRRPAAGPADASAVLASEPAPDLFTALQQQLGLKLEPKKLPLDVIVVDHAERVPSAN